MWTRRRILVAAMIAVPLGAVGIYRLMRFPPDTEPQGAYMRIAYSIGRGEPEGAFAYLEEAAQHAAFTVGDYAEQSALRIRQAYPEPERTHGLAQYGWALEKSDGPDVWARLANERGWIGRLRRDLSGVDHVEVAGERATVVTARGTRYPFRRRPNGIWGLTLFTVELQAEAERLARDWDRIQRAADDYQREGPPAESASPAVSAPPSP
jgi:hypothetical protein